ncbi:thioesterase family protein [Acidisphaera sp. L21]|uniref:acyl-CoA thioesterase n=1 Tax=Acidisphaera sp. L21 TaxID=1641851 RepID=UPI00131EB18C|nr:thioesterase family protein [Acidisphaera sp. L21]
MIAPDTPRPRAPISRRADYRAFRLITTRWMDNDVLGHVNNALYYSFFDTTVTGWLIERDLIGLHDGTMWMVAETSCRYLSEVAFPDVLTIGLRLGKLGNSSVRWELAVFRGEADEASAEGHFVHVHMNRQTRRPTPVPDSIREILATMQI